MVLNRGYDYREVIGSTSHDQSAVEHLALTYPRATREVWLERIERGEVWCSERPAHAGQRLRRGEVLVWRRPPWEEPPAPLYFAVVWCDTDLLAVVKPRGLPTLPAGGLYLEHTLLHQVRSRFAGASPVHRLDTKTSGLVLFARTARGRTRLSRQFRDGSIERVYLGLLSGVAVQKHFAVDQPIGSIEHSPTGTLHAATALGKKSKTNFEVMEQRTDCFLARIVLGTGRPHQIRIHAACAGHPLVGENLYGSGGLPASVAVPADAPIHLHACELRFAHPDDGRPVEISCGAPAALRKS